MNKLLASVLDDLFWLHADTTGIWSSDLGNPRQESCLCCSAVLPAAPRRCPRLPRAFCLVQSHTRCRQSAGLTRVPSNVLAEFQKYLLAFRWDPERFFRTCWLTDVQVLKVVSEWELCYLILSGVSDGAFKKPLDWPLGSCTWSLRQNVFWWLFLALLLSCVRLLCSWQHAPHEATFEKGDKQWGDASTSMSFRHCATSESSCPSLHTL